MTNGSVPQMALFPGTTATFLGSRVLEAWLPASFAASEGSVVLAALGRVEVGGLAAALRCCRGGLRPSCAFAAVAVTAA